MQTNVKNLYWCVSHDKSVCIEKDKLRKLLSLQFNCDSIDLKFLMLNAGKVLRLNLPAGKLKIKQLSLDIVECSEYNGIKQYKAINITDGEESQLMTKSECEQVIKLAHECKLLGSFLLIR